MGPRGTGTGPEAREVSRALGWATQPGAEHARVVREEGAASLVTGSGKGQRAASGVELEQARLGNGGGVGGAREAPAGGGGGSGGGGGFLHDRPGQVSAGAPQRRVSGGRATLLGGHPPWSFAVSF